MTHPLTAWLRRRLRRESRTSPDSPRGFVVHDVDQPHDEVEHYWTDDRVRDAQPRTIVRENSRGSTDSPGANGP